MLKVIRLLCIFSISTIIFFGVLIFAAASQAQTPLEFLAPPEWIQDIILVPSGGLARTEKTVELMQGMDCPSVLFSGKGHGGDSALWLGNYAASLGADGSCFLYETEALNTLQNLQLSKILLDDLQVSRVLIVTSSSHLRRVALLSEVIFADANYEVRGLGVGQSSLVKRVREYMRTLLYSFRTSDPHIPLSRVL